MRKNILNILNQPCINTYLSLLQNNIFRMNNNTK
jgi:hypothetical protein